MIEMTIGRFETMTSSMHDRPRAARPSGRGRPCLPVCGTSGRVLFIEPLPHVFRRRVANRALSRLIDHRLERTAVIPSFEPTIRTMEQLHLTPVTVIDVGVADGTPRLYETFPNAKFLLIDPTPQSSPFMKEWSQRLDAEIFNVALGDRRARLPLNIRPEHSGSTFFEEVGYAEVSERREVDVFRFDELVRSVRRPSLMKIDVQGAELMVLRGMGELIHEIDCFVIDTSLIPTIHEGPEFVDLVMLMKENGFVLFDVIALTRRPLDNALAQIDAVELAAQGRSPMASVKPRNPSPARSWAAPGTARQYRRPW
jgi:FkbM family methyltransferase